MAQPVATKTQHWIAIVDDNEAVCRSLSLLLRSKGHGVKTFPNGLAFLSRAPMETYNCVLIDFKMSPHDGFALLHELRARGNDTPAIMITGWQSPDLLRQALQAGFKDVIYKPMLDDTLLAAIDRVLLI
ncbi:MAG: response regulator [Alphaproteobacteria bacterium]|nr:response regulator [Alphaproteobacteria bacterium]